MTDFDIKKPDLNQPSDQTFKETVISTNETGELRCLQCGGNIALYFKTFENRTMSKINPLVNYWNLTSAYICNNYKQFSSKCLSVAGNLFEKYPPLTIATTYLIGKTFLGFFEWETLERFNILKKILILTGSLVPFEVANYLIDKKFGYSAIKLAGLSGVILAIHEIYSSTKEVLNMVKLEEILTD